MINLPDLTSRLMLVTGQGVLLDVVADYVDALKADLTPQGIGVSPVNVPAVAGTYKILDPPTLSTQVRNAKRVNIRNRGSSPCDVTVQRGIGGLVIEEVKQTLNANDTLEFVEGVGWFVLQATSWVELFKILSADDAGGQNVATAQPWFPTAGGVTVISTTTYWMEGVLRTTRAAGATSHTTGLLFGGTATLTNIDYHAECRTGDVNTAPGATANTSHIQVATNTQVKAASTATTEDTLLKVLGVVRINAGGTFIPQFIYSAIPGGAPTIKRGSYFRLRPIGDNNVTQVGTWA